VLVDLTGEIRRQLHLQLEIVRGLYDVKAVAAFQGEVVDAIGEVAPETRQRIVQRLVERRALRSALRLPQAGA